MSDFHPRTLLVLREQLAIHTSRLDSARYGMSWMQHRNVSAERLAECQEVIDWRTAVVDDLDRLIDHVGQAATDAAEDDRIAAELGIAEPLLLAHSVVGKIIPILAPFSTYCWDLRPEERFVKVQSNPHGGAENQRAVLADIADCFPAFEYAEKDYGNYIEISATGTIDGITVKVWDHVAPGDEVTFVRVERVPAVALDEDQPAAPARGHGQVDGDADEDFEFAPMSAEDYAAEQAAFDAANVEITAKLTRERRRAAAQDCEDSCGGEGVCAFGPHDPITTQPTTSTTGATDEP